MLISTSQKDPSSKLLGDYIVSLEKFEGIEKLFSFFQTESFKKIGEVQKSDQVSRKLCELIQDAKEPCFLLAAVIDFIDKVVKLGIVQAYSLSHFELWLNQFSNLSKEENYRIRGKIVGRFVPRESYQTLFPIGMGKMYPGSHYVTAHSSPDLDTTVASFWGWIDAFAARVSEGLHIWNVPGGAPSAQVEVSLLFNKILGQSCFEHISKSRSTLSLSGIDLMGQKGLIKKHLEDSTFSIDHDREHNAVVVTDESGRYLGDWRNIDVEGVRQVVILMNNCLSWFSTQVYLKLVSLFAKQNLHRSDLPAFAEGLFGMKISECLPVKDFTEKQRKHFHSFLEGVLKIHKGIESTFEEFALGMKQVNVSAFQEFIEEVAQLSTSSIFDTSGILKEARSDIFHQIEKIISALDKAIQNTNTYVESLYIALKIKKEVLGHKPQVVSYRDDVEEIRSKMDSYSYLTVTSSDDAGKLVPLGVIRAADVNKPVLGTVTLRDFCNREETKIPSYFEVISVIDHHKSALGTTSAPTAYITDQQSSNALVADKSFEINAPFSLQGRGLDAIEKQIEELKEDLSSKKNMRLFQRLLEKKISAAKTPYFVDPSREYLEYLHCLYAILDDTDLLSKVSYRDLNCIASLLNKMKSIACSKEMEIISFDDIAYDAKFVSIATRRVLQNEDMYSLYKKIYSLKEESVEHNLRICVKGEPSNVFADTKQQNGCCRVGQTKMFAKNYSTFKQQASEIRALWYVEAKQYQQERSEVDLHIHMVSTVPGADDMYHGNEGNYEHKDELWIWIPSQEQAIEHLKIFLNAFKQAPAFVGNHVEVEFLGDNAKELDKIFNESFFAIPRITHKEDKKISIPVAVLRFKAGTINSRKAMISPYLPKLIS